MQKLFLLLHEKVIPPDALEANLKILGTLTGNVCGGVGFQYSH